MTDAVGRLIDFALSAGLAGDIRLAIPLRSRLTAPDHQLADTTYDDDAFKAFLIGREAVPVIRPNPTRSGSQHSTKRALQAKESRRTLLLTPEGLAACGNMLRQARTELRRFRRTRRYPHMVDVVQTGA